MSEGVTTITNDPQALLRVAKLDSWRHSLPPKLGIDQFRTALPLMVHTHGRRPAILAKEIDRTNLKAVEGLEADLIFHTPYFTFDGAESPPSAHATLADAVESVAGPKPTLDPAMSVSLYGELRGVLGLADKPSAPLAAGLPAELNHYLVPRSAVPRRSAARRDAAIQAAWSYVDGLGCRSMIAPWLSAPMDDPLRSLDELMVTGDLDVLFCCTPLTMQELSGVPAVFFGGGDFALYAQGDRFVHLLSCRELPCLGLPDAAAAKRATVLALADGGRLGFEELNLTQAVFDGFGFGAAGAIPASRVLRRWRERRAWADLAFVLIGTQVTLAGIDAALALVEEALGAGQSVTELDAYDRYSKAVQAEIERLSLPIRVRTYFNHTHAGDRSGIPASATAHRLSPLTSLKIDAGLEIYDDTGFHRATSDVTRSLVGSPDANDFYQLLDSALVEAAIPACRAGATGADVFAAGIRFLEPHRGELAAVELCPPGDKGLSEMVDRDIGHLLGKQEPATTVFEKGNVFCLEAGMVAAAEFQWPYREWCIGVEDVFLITGDEPINLTRSTSDE